MTRPGNESNPSLAEFAMYSVVQGGSQAISSNRRQEDKGHDGVGQVVVFLELRN
jgi:hypothetical protein